MSFTGPAFFGNNDASVNRSGASGTPSQHARRRSSDHHHDRPSASSLRRPSTSSSASGHAGRPRAGSRTKRRPSFRNDDGLVHDSNATNTRSNSNTHAMDGSKADSSSEGLMEDEDARREEEVHHLARKLTKQSTYSNLEASPLDAGPESKLNPNSPNFSAKAWAKSLVNLQQSDEKNPQRTAGVAFRNLNAYGFGASTDYQKTVGNIWLQVAGSIRHLLGAKEHRIDILQGFDGVVNAGEMLVVLGPPGSGCSTFLKTISGETYGFNVDKDSYLNYQGISAKDMYKKFRGEAIYTAEVDVHFPMLSVDDTLTFAARARVPRNPPGGVDKNTYAAHMRDVFMAIFGISHTKNTRVGNDYVRGISGGERKRVTIAEAALSGAPLQCWDNSTRGLDSANAVEFCKTLRLSTDILGATACVSIYQAPQSAYDYFDKALVLYEGRQIYFGPTTEAKQYFLDQGFDCPDRQTTADFLTSMTSPQERVIRPGWDDRVPRTPDDFAALWKKSQHNVRLQEQLDKYDREFPIGGEHLEKFKQSRKAQQATHQRVSSPYTLSYVQQVQLCLWRGFQRLRGDPSITITQLFGNSITALIIGSVFYNLRPDTNSFFQRGALLFFAILMNAFGSALEILTLYAQRPIVEKHARYALYHPSAEAFASMLTDMPFKVCNAIFFNLVLYFMTNLRREPGAFFFFLLMSFILTLTMSMFFRTIASLSRSLAQAMAPAAILILAIIIYTGFAIPIKDMLGWSRWINYIDPVAYGFESLMINEFHNRNFTCSLYVPQGPGYPKAGTESTVCTAVGSKPGLTSVNGDDYLESSFAYLPSHKWRNVGIVLGFMIGLMVIYLIAAELVREKKSKGEVLVFRRGQLPAALKESPSDIEAGSNKPKALGALQKETTMFEGIQRQEAIFSWKDVCYDVKIKGENRTILNHVDGWVKPGTLTALMGVSGAGKTTLLDALATRTTMGVISGEMLVDGRQRDASFQRKTGYVQQQDLHLATATVREALNFSALLRQPHKIPRKEKLAYVEEVIKLLDMDEYADSVVGVPGEGLNVEQRKRLTIGVELAAKPELLLFLDEPTSGLDSQTSWAICDLMEKLTKNGQAILCTIHQPSAMLFQRFDRLLFLKTGGETVYFGELGENASTMISYFERTSGIKCPKDANPAEWMLEVIGAAPGSETNVDWRNAWRQSPEYAGVQQELQRLKTERRETATSHTDPNDRSSFAEFAAPFSVQLWEVQKRVFEQYWRTPSYIYSKAALCILSALFIGFSFFKAQLSQQGLQNQMFAIFMLFTIFGQLVQQIMPHFVVQRALYEVRERPAKTYSWKAFMLCNIIVELPWQTLMSVIMFFCWYYPVGMYHNAQPTGAVHERGALFFLLIWTFLIFTSTFTHMCIAAIETAEEGGNIANLLFSLSLIFCGVLATPTSLPGFWIFMYYVSPFTYLASAMLSVGVANTKVVCAANELLKFKPASGQSCSTYMASYIKFAGGYLQDPNATDSCQFCQLDNTNVFLKAVGSKYSDRWRNFGILWLYVVFNVFAALALYWLVRMPKKSKQSKEESRQSKEEELENKSTGEKLSKEVSASEAVTPEKEIGGKTAMRDKNVEANAVGEKTQ